MDQNRNQSYFIGVFLQTTLIVQKFSSCINRISTVNTRVRVTCYIFFGKPYLLIPVNTIYTYHLLPFTQLSILYQLSYHIFTTIISILQYCYHIVTIIISTLYSYIYRYNLSIKTYNSQYRYKHTESMIRIITKNTEMNDYTVYT